MTETSEPQTPGDRSPGERTPGNRTPGNRTLGVLAGGGVLPGRVAAAAQAAGRTVFIVGLEGFAEPAVVGRFPHAMARIGAAGRILQLLKDNAVQDVILIGPVRRPSFLDLRPDGTATRLLARVGRAAFAGDNSLLSAVVKVLGEEGFNVIGAQDILTESQAPPGLLTQAAPDAQAMADIGRGVTVARALGAVDVGQGCVVQGGLVLSVEAIEGTDAMLARAGTLRRNGLGGVLVKLVKPGQERRADPPTIGPVTVENAAAAGLRGLAFEAAGTLLAERQHTVELADRIGFFLLALGPAELSGRE